MCKCEHKKRYFLPIILIVFLILIEEVRDFIYLPIIVFISFSVLFWNYPWLVYRTVSKPFYYEDLFIDEKQLPNHNINESLRIKFKTIFEWVLIITNSLLMAALSEYWLFRTNNVDEIFKLLGVTGGLVKLFQIINNTIGRLMLKILKTYIIKENIETGEVFILTNDTDKWAEAS